MTTVEIRPIEATSATTEYRCSLPSARWAIAAVSGCIVCWALLAFVALSVTTGLLGLGLAGVLGVFDAMFATPTRVHVTPDGVTLGFWNRTKQYGSKAIVVTHEVPRGRISVRRRGGRRALARFYDDKSSDAARAFVAAGVEIRSLYAATAWSGARSRPRQHRNRRASHRRLARNMERVLLCRGRPPREEHAAWAFGSTRRKIRATSRSSIRRHRARRRRRARPGESGRARAALRHLGMARGTVAAVLPNGTRCTSILAGAASRLLLRADQLPAEPPRSRTSSRIPRRRCSSATSASPTSRAAADEAAIPATHRLAHGSIPGFRSFAEIVDRQPTTLPEDRSTGAAMHYTSGTTGQPKGVRRKLNDIDPDTSAELFTGLLLMFGIQPERWQRAPVDRRRTTTPRSRRSPATRCT